MKKSLLSLAALSLSVAVSACSMHDGSRADNNNPPQAGEHHKDWNQKEHMRMMAENLFNAMDTNGDGVVTKQEYNDYTRKWFRDADVSRSGELTLEEFEAKLKHDKEAMKSRHMRQGDMQNEGRNMDDRGDTQNAGDMNNDNSDMRSGENNQNYGNPSNRY